MIASLFRPNKGRPRLNKSTTSSPGTGSPDLKGRLIRTRARPNPGVNRANIDENESDIYDEDEDAITNEDDSRHPLLPLFSSAHLGMSLVTQNDTLC